MKLSIYDGAWNQQRLTRQSWMVGPKILIYSLCLRASRNFYSDEFYPLLDTWWLSVLYLGAGTAYRNHFLSVYCSLCHPRHSHLLYHNFLSQNAPVEHPLGSCLGLSPFLLQFQSLEKQKNKQQGAKFKLKCHRTWAGRGRVYSAQRSIFQVHYMAIVYQKRPKHILPPRDGILLFGLRSSIYTCRPATCAEPAYII